MKNKKERYHAVPVEISTDGWETSFYGLLGKNGVIFYNGRNGGRFDAKEINAGVALLRPQPSAGEGNKDLFDTYMSMFALEANNRVEGE